MEKICYMVIYDINIKQVNKVNKTKHDNIIVEFGKMDNPLNICSHIDSAFERFDIEGANDNASGTAILLKLAITFSKFKTDPNGIRFIFYQGEEYNFYGCLNILFDMKEVSNLFNCEEVFYMVRSGTLRKYKKVNINKIIEIDVVGKGNVLNIYSSRNADIVIKKIENIDMDNFEKVRICLGGAGINSISEMLGLNVETYFLQLSGMLDILHTKYDSFTSIDEVSLDKYYRFIEEFILQLL